MKSNFYTFVALMATTLAGIIPAMAQGPVNDTLYMGAGYANEVYYSMSAGIKGAVDRKQWDIAFRTYQMSSSILTNDAANNDEIALSGVKLYTYPKSAISDWATVDTAGFYLGNWENMVNSTTDYEDGAFSRHQKGHPDYGWGIYNSVHNIIGDSLYIIKLRDGSFRKLWIVKKLSSDNIYQFRYANIDGTNDTTIDLDCNPYSTKNFVGFSIVTNKVVDFEPVASTEWDLLFTKYMYTYPANSTTPYVQYPVIGVLSNCRNKEAKKDPYHKVKVLKFTQVTDFPPFSTYSMDSTRSPIGWEWKTFNNGYTVVDPLVYFVQDLQGKIFKLIFKEFKGSSTGRIVLQKDDNYFTGIDEIAESGFNAAVYPNPVKDLMNLVVNPGKSKSVQVSVIDLSGRSVVSKKYDLPSGDLSTIQIPVQDIKSGMYMLKIQSGSSVISRKVIVNK